MALHRSTFAVQAMSRILGVSRSGFYDWLKRPLSRRKQEDEFILRIMWKIFLESGKRYGRDKIQDELRKRSIRIGDDRAYRLLKMAGIRPITQQKRRVKTTDSSHNYPVSANLLKRNFETEEPNRVWVSDITYIRARTGWLFLCVIVDLYSRKIVGWSLRPHMQASLVTEALNRALASRKVKPWNLIFHSDRGSQYAGREFRRALQENRIISSMSRTGDCYDNAVAESTFALIKRELVHVSDFENIVDARRELFRYIEGFYNRRRTHSYLDYLSPDDFEYAGKVA